MARTSRLYNELLKLLGQSDEWADLRHLQTVSWMVVGLICSGCVSLTKWTLYVESRAIFAQSHQRRRGRWLHNPRLNVHRLYSPLIQAALGTWGVTVITIIEDTTLLWNTYCLIRVSVQYRGRAVPIAGAGLGTQKQQCQLRRVQGVAQTGCSVTTIWSCRAIYGRPGLCGYYVNALPNRGVRLELSHPPQE